MPPFVRRTPELGCPDAGVLEGPLFGAGPDEGGRRLVGTLAGESRSPRTEMGTASKPRAMTPENDVDVGGWLSGPVRGSSTPGSLRRGPRSGGLCGLLTSTIFRQPEPKVHEEAREDVRVRGDTHDAGGRPGWRAEAGRGDQGKPGGRGTNRRRRGDARGGSGEWQSNARGGGGSRGEGGYLDLSREWALMTAHEQDARQAR